VSGTRLGDSSRSRRPLTLLILDDREDVRRSLARYFRLFVRTVVDASSTMEAERLLQEHQPELLLTDYWLGGGQPTSVMMLPQWRARFGCLQRVVLMTGSRGALLSVPPGVDALFRKPLDLDAVRVALLEPDASQPASRDSVAGS